MDFQQFCSDFRVQTTPKSHPHHRAGWTNVSCPFCSGHSGFHLGYNIRSDFFTCYRCGWHPVTKVIARFARTTEAEAKELLKRYTGKTVQEIATAEVIRPDHTFLPPGTGAMTRRHKEYLAKRNFDPDRLEKLWGLMGTGHTGEYKFRIIAPITFRYQLVSFQGRDITERQSARYKTCQSEREVISHKHILYGWDQIPYGSTSCILVEGITGVWRLGPGALATFGVKYSASQIRLLASRFDRIFTLFDPDEAGSQAETIITKLSAMGKEAIQLEIWSQNFDSGNLPQDIADKMIKEVMK